MKKIIIFFAILFAWIHVSVAQNLDPTVEVTRGYKAELVDAHKPSLEMAVPDSVYKFDLDFDYSVSDKTYGGSYEFVPYSMDMRPQSPKEAPTVFYLNAGAGYTLHPTLDVIYSPVLNGKFSMDFYGKHRSYIGDYRAPHVGEHVAGQTFKGGYDMMSKANADFGYDWEKAVMGFGVSYYGVAVNDILHKDAFNALDARFSVKSKSLWSKRFMYDIALGYRLGGGHDVREHLVDLDMKFGPTQKARRKLFLDLGASLAVYQKHVSATFAHFYLAPHYLFQKNGFKADVGVRAAYVLPGAEHQPVNDQFVYPEVHLSCLIKDVMRLYVDVTGGEVLNTYSSLLERNHHFHLNYSLAEGQLLSSSQVRVRPEAGIEGRITNFFTYHVKGGYAFYEASPVDALKVFGSDYLPYLGYTKRQQWYGALDCTLGLKSFRFDGELKYTRTWGMDAAPENVFYVMPARWNASVSAVYNWNKRLYFGLDGEMASSAMTCDKSVYVPYYVDLGAFAEYVVNKKISIWLRGGNLLNMEIQRNLLYAEKGINFTAGFCLNLQ